MSSIILQPLAMQTVNEEQCIYVPSKLFPAQIIDVNELAAWSDHARLALVDFGRGPKPMQAIAPLGQAPWYIIAGEEVTPGNNPAEAGSG
jgi:hypothetical protein